LFLSTKQHGNIVETFAMTEPEFTTNQN